MTLSDYTASELVAELNCRIWEEIQTLSFSLYDLTTNYHAGSGAPINPAVLTDINQKVDTIKRGAKVLKVLNTEYRV